MLGITLGAEDRSKLGGDEGSGPVFSVQFFEGVKYGNLEYRSEELYVSSLRDSMGSEGGSDIGSSDGILVGKISEKLMDLHW